MQKGKMMDELSRWYENMTYEEAKSVLREKMDNLKMSFIAAGYYLKYIRDHEQYREDGYESIWEFAEDNYGIKKSTASRWMSMNDKFSKGGNSPILAEEFREFEKSQLQEMLYLEDKQIETVTPDMTVKEIREVRKPEEPAREREERTGPIDRGCITGKNPNGNCVCCGKDGVECCGQCDDGCNGRCGWIDSAVATSQQEESDQMPDMNPPEEAVAQPALQENSTEEVEKVEVEIIEDNELPAKGKFEELSDQTDMDLLYELLDQAHERLRLLMEEFSEKDVRVRKQKLIVGAYAGMIADFDEGNIKELEQPELPKLRNNEQRKAFLDNYQTWPIWFEVPQASEVYHRFDLPDGSSIVICEYHMWLSWKERYSDEDPHSTGTREYLLKPGYHYLHDCRTNTTTLVDHLKNMQKGEKKNDVN